MRRILSSLAFVSLFLGLQASTRAQDIVVPAGTLLHCTLDEPNLSSATASVGDPVICHLSSLQEFGHVVFPRGSYLGGHLEAYKEPGHFFGKGSLKMEFDRIGLPNTDIPVPSKVIAARGYRVDRTGDIIGRGHAKRDTVEWLLPPLWPWKVLTLPARGPRPTLKGEEPITLRLMDDIVVPRTMAAADLSDRHPSFDRLQPPTRPAFFDESKYFDRSTSIAAKIAYVPPSIPAASPLQPPVSESNRAGERQQLHLTLIALKSDEIYAVAKYRVDGGSLSYVLPAGEKGSIDETAVDWRKTSQLNARQSVSITSETDARTH